MERIRVSDTAKCEFSLNCFISFSLDLTDGKKLSSCICTQNCFDINLYCLIRTILPIVFYKVM